MIVNGEHLCKLFEYYFPFIDSNDRMVNLYKFNWKTMWKKIFKDGKYHFVLIMGIAYETQRHYYLPVLPVYKRITKIVA